MTDGGAGDGGGDPGRTDEALSTSTICGSCGTRGTGRFCGECGASLGGVQCGRCGHTPPMGARFCTSCGARMGSGGPAAGGFSGSGSGAPPPLVTSRTLAWITGAVLAGSLFLMVGLPLLQGRDMPSAVAPPPVAQPGGQAPDISNLTPREAADRLFNRIVQAQEQGDSVEMVTFLPMAIAAYQRAEPLDADGGFHLSLLERLALEFDAALATAESKLATEPNHLLNLHAAAEAAVGLGDEHRAREYFTRFQQNYESERARDVAEYQIHNMLLPRMKEDADRYLAGTR